MKINSIIVSLVSRSEIYIWKQYGNFGVVSGYGRKRLNFKRNCMHILIASCKTSDTTDGFDVSHFSLKMMKQ